MGTLTKVELEDEVRAALGRRTDLDTRLGRFVNLAQQRIARIKDFDEMQIISQTVLPFNSDDNDRFLVLPTIREVYSIVLLDGANSRKLVGRTPSFMDRMQAKPEYWTRSWPVVYCLWGNTIEMFPMQKSGFSIRMRWTQWPLELTEDTDVSQFLQKDDIIIQFALSYANYSLGKEETAKKHEARALQLLAEAKETDRTKPDENILPADSDSQMAGYPTRVEPWNDPFYRGI